MIEETDIPLIEYYESMRLYANGSIDEKSIPMGIHIFKKKGMKAWVDAWHSTQAIKAIIMESGEDATIPVNVPDVMISDLTVLLTQMILGTNKEKDS